MDTKTASIDKDFLRDRTVVASIENFIEGCCFRVRVELSTEYLTVSFYADRFTSCSTFTSVCDFVSVIESWIRSKNQSCIEDDYTEADILHMAFWDAVEACLGKSFGSKNKNELFEEDGVLIGDFRGVIVPSIPREQEGGISGDDMIAHFPDISIPAQLRVGSGTGSGGVYDTFMRNMNFFYSVLGMDTLGETFNKVKSHLHLESNVILCGMLDGAALYGSTLGNPYLLQKLKREPIPVCYFLIYGGRSSFEIGRLIQKLHSLGELRVAALIDYDTVRRLSLSIRELGQLITEGIYNYSAAKSISSDRVSEVVGSYSEIGKHCHGGLIFRINRAEYYRTSLYSLIDHLHQAPIPGWQSYKEFIEVNVAPRFRTIVSIGDRYKQMAIRVDRFVSLYDISRQFSFTKLLSIVSLLALLLGTITIFFGLKRDLINPLFDYLQWGDVAYWIVLSSVGFVQLMTYSLLIIAVMRFLRSHQVNIR